MGHSCLEYRGKFKFVQDFEIELVANSVLSLLKRSDLEPKFARVWKEELTMPINGGIDLQLDALFPTESDGKKLIKLIKEAELQFTEPEFIPLEDIKRVFPYDLKMEEGGLAARTVSNYFNNFIDFLDDALKEQR